MKACCYKRLIFYHYIDKIKPGQGVILASKGFGGVDYDKKCKELVGAHAQRIRFERLRTRIQ